MRSSNEAIIDQINMRDVRAGNLQESHKTEKCSNEKLGNNETPREGTN
jgi:hypothetical protein